MSFQTPKLSGTVEAPVRLSTEPYISEAYAREEKNLLWRKVWQLACREEEILGVGDFYTYDIHDQSIIVMRSGEDEITAYHNACRHRGRRLTKGCGRIRHIRCPYHGWQWNLKGENTEVFEGEDWGGALDNVDLSLRAIKVERWAGFVFINLDPDCEPLGTFLQTVPGWLGPFEMEKMRYKWRQWMKFPCNWKVVTEAFIEGYHAPIAHPQVMRYGAGRTGSSAEGLHGRLFSLGVVGGGIGTALAENIDMDVRTLPHKMMKLVDETVWTNTTNTFIEASARLPEILPETAKAAEVSATLLELARQMDADRGVDWPTIDPQHMMDVGINWHVFPNTILLPNVTFCLGFRLRPDGFDPDSCIIEVFALERYPEGQEPKTEWVERQSRTGDNWPLLIKQDFSNLEAVQLGMHSDSHVGFLPNPAKEAVVINFQRNLASYMGRCAPELLSADLPSGLGN